MKWLEKDQQLLAMTDNVDYDVEGTSLVKSRLICHIIRQTHIHSTHTPLFNSPLAGRTWVSRHQNSQKH